MYDSCQKLVTTPNVLTEVSNLANKLWGDLRTQLYEALDTIIGGCAEEYIESRAVSGCDDFSRLGLTDCTILALPPKSCLVITTDRKLAEACIKVGIDSINYNHLRSAELLS
jgi:hypothetical protein